MQKLTLLDYPDKTACTLFTRGCNFSCPFCHNPSLIAPVCESLGQDMTEEAVFDFLESRRGLLDAVCISGGEPLLHGSIIDFISKVKAMGFLVKIDTNGSCPDRLRELAETAVIDYVAMDIKNEPSRYAETAGIEGYDCTPVLSSIEYLLTSAVPYEFRTTVVKDYHTADNLIAIARLISNAEKYYLQCFDHPDAALRSGLSAYSKDEMKTLLERVKAVLPCTSLRV